MGVRIAGDVEPVACHLLTEKRACQEVIDQSLVSVCGFVTKELVRLFRRRGQSGQGEGDSTQ